MTITSLVNALPEIYQPVYGHPEFDIHAARPSADRLRLIVSVYTLLSAELDRPLRVLDLGCAQGYFSLHLAALGATVTGLDRLDQNISLCNALAGERSSYSLQFEVGSIEDKLRRMAPGEFDLVIGMSVMHHICAHRGAQWTQALLGEASNKIEAGLFEAALREEPAEWAEQQPETPDGLYQDFAFLVRAGEFATHLSTHTRPVYFASNKFWLLDNSLSRFDHWAVAAHEFDRVSNERGRRYFHNETQFLKLVHFHGPQGALNRQEFEREIGFLCRPESTQLGFPAKIHSALGSHEGWILRERISGELLSTRLLGDKHVNPVSVISDLLRQLAALEAMGLFHEDVRTWNILIRPQGEAILIDYGSISSTRADREYPKDWRIPLLVLLTQLFRHPQEIQWPPDLTELHPDHLPEPAASLAWKMWGTPLNDWTWKKIASEWASGLASPPFDGRGLRDSLGTPTKEEVRRLASRVQDLETGLTMMQDRLSRWSSSLAFMKPVWRVVRAIVPRRFFPKHVSHVHGETPRSIACHVCRRGQGQLYNDANWTGYPGYVLLQCDWCGSICSDPLPSDEVLSRLYQTDFDYRWYQDHYDAKLKDCRARIVEYAPLLGKRVLDFGGGVGYFSRAAAEAGLDSTTYDPYLHDSAPKGLGWDSVVALHVLEHSNNLDKTITQIKEFLAPGGKVILAVPNASGLGYKKLGMRWVWAQPPLVHIFHFTPKGLKALLARHGFTNLAESYHERWDANLHCDLIHAEQFHNWDADWGRRPFKPFQLYRRWIARRNAKRRFEGLDQSLSNYDPHSDAYSELQITGVLENK
ncbi:MAG TPA: methyltransferase domain-containing protein [Polaromonas sp.]|uniref:methyltransferase domain-containing protein n=1 Tax=Polaromonas sp. TaxID=1869339 RepID=UPI002D3D2B4A|nr:methyltransferase domain-containing protein [Polaromonas sp.]HYW56935.1 methyltransferase domain-containing protein [Polaromonas sp.]